MVVQLSRPSSIAAPAPPPATPHAPHSATPVHGAEPICCTPIAPHLMTLSNEQLRERMALVEAQSLEAMRDLRRLYREERQRTTELEQARAQMLAYADDVRSAFKAERARRAQLERQFVETVRALASAIDARDPYTGGHVDRVASYAVALGRRLDWTEDQLRVLEVGALLHDIGKIAVVDAILRKNGPLDDSEWGVMRQHPEVGAKMLTGLESLRHAVPAVLHHHERFDGNGYPTGLAGESIPAIARIVTIADAFDAMLTDRPYRQGLPLDMAVEELERFKVTQFDPCFTAAFLEMIERGQLKILKRGATLN